MLTRRNKQFQRHLTATQLGDNENTTVVFVNEVDSMCRDICAASKLDPVDVVLIRGSVDGGGAVVKLSFCFISKSEVPAASSSTVFSGRGVRKTYLFVAVTGIEESYDVLRKMLACIDMDKLAAFFANAKLIWANDTKMNWIFAGMSHGGKRPCTACLWKPSDRWNDALPRRTFGGNIHDAASFVEATKGKSDSFRKRMVKEFNNCVTVPVLQCEPETMIETVLTVNPLHMKLRCTNKTIKHMNEVAPATTTVYLKKLGVHKEGYHGEFEGRPCSKIVSGYVLLASVVRDECKNVLQQQVQVTRLGNKRRRVSSRNCEQQLEQLVQAHPATPYVDLYKAHDGIMRCCYGSDLNKEYEHCFLDYKRAVDKIRCSMSVSMHMLADHTPLFCAALNSGTVDYSEETHESLHDEFKQFKTQWKVPPVGAPKHSDFLLRMVGGLNAAHAFSPSV